MLILIITITVLFILSITTTTTISLIHTISIVIIRVRNLERDLITDNPSLDIAKTILNVVHISTLCKGVRLFFPVGCIGGALGGVWTLVTHQPCRGGPRVDYQVLRLLVGPEVQVRIVGIVLHVLHV